MDKPSLPKGTRDFGPVQMAKRQHILNTIRKVFEKYGFQPLETPAMENLSTLTGKYGEEGDQLLFRILNSGDFLKDIDGNRLKELNSKQLAGEISEKGLKYDLTVPFARYVVMNRHEIVLPFKRYQIQPVWRADRPQKGRYREFYQCDADVVGTDSLVCEAEIILMIKEVFSKLKIPDYTIKINHRGILTGLSQLSGSKENENALFVSMDKLDKSDEKSVREELSSKGFSKKGIDQLFNILNFHGSNEQKIKHVDEAFASLPDRKKSASELSNVFELLGHFGAGDDHVEFDLSLARGLSYYTGCIFEVKVNNVSIGSVTGGGRYDNLTQSFGSKEKLSGVGISFGIDRLYDVMEELKLFPDEALASSTVLVCHLDEASQLAGFKTVYQLRAAGVAAEIYPDPSKLKKQLEYADRKKIPFTIVIGEDEVKSGMLTIKNMKTGQQEKLRVEEIIKVVSKQ